MTSDGELAATVTVTAAAVTFGRQRVWGLVRRGHAIGVAENPTQMLNSDLMRFDAIGRGGD